MFGCFSVFKRFPKQKTPSLWRPNFETTCQGWVVMFAEVIILGVLALFTESGLCCTTKEYKTDDGQCCPLCQEGTVVRQECTQISGTGCRPCKNGTYVDQPNGFKECITCTICSQGLGLSVQQECTAKTDTVCDALTGYFCITLAKKSGCSLAEKHKPCKAGNRTKEAGTNRADTVCEPCKEGYYSADGLNCTAWTKCSENQVKKKEGSTTSDVVCSSASRSHYFYIHFLLTICTLFGLGITGCCHQEKN